MLLAVRAVPASCNEWAQAMLTEFSYLDHDRDALSWACGCVMAAVRLRYEAVELGNLKISRWILAPELLFCFLPLSMLWLGSTYQLMLIISGNTGFIYQNFFGTPGGIPILLMLIAWFCLGISGPISLFIAFRLIILNRTTHRGSLGKIMTISPLLLAVITLSVWRSINANLPDDYWAAVLIEFILPALGAAHLYYVYTPVQHTKTVC